MEWKAVVKTYNKLLTIFLQYVYNVFSKQPRIRFFYCGTHKYKGHEAKYLPTFCRQAPWGVVG